MIQDLIAMIRYVLGKIGKVMMSAGANDGMFLAAVGRRHWLTQSIHPMPMPSDE